MSKVSVPRRFVLLLLIAVASFAIFKCTSFKYNANKETFCRSGNFSETRPLICVDENTLTASPSHAKAYDTESKHGLSTGRPVTINWYSQHTADLQITMKTDGCTTPVRCDGLGHCSATVIKFRAGETKRVCTYGMAIGDKSVDPDDDIILTPCCH